MFKNFILNGPEQIQSFMTHSEWRQTVKYIITLNQDLCIRTKTTLEFGDKKTYVWWN